MSSETKSKSKSKSKSNSNSKSKSSIEHKIASVSREESDMSVDIAPEVLELFSTPAKKVTYFDAYKKILSALCKKYDTDVEDIHNVLNPVESYDDFDKRFLKAKKKNTKSENKEKGKVKPVDENGVKLSRFNDTQTISAGHKLFNANYDTLITDTDYSNEEYHKNGKFHKAVYKVEKWKSLSKKEQSKYDKKAHKINEIYDTAYEKQKPEEKPKKSCTSFMLFSKDYREQNKEELAELSFGESGKVIGAKWNAMKETDVKTVEKYNDLSLKLKEEYKIKLVAYEKRQIELKKKDAEQESDDAGPSDSSDSEQSDAEQSDAEQSDADQDHESLPTIISKTKTKTKGNAKPNAKPNTKPNAKGNKVNTKGSAKESPPDTSVYDAATESDSDSDSD